MTSRALRVALMLISAFGASQLAFGQTTILRAEDLSGAWYDPSTSGQGFMFDMAANADGSANVFAGWFTFTLPGLPNEAYPTWFSIQGKIAALNSASPIELFYTRGGAFDSPPTVRATSSGSGTLSFADCTHATLTYVIPGDYLNSPTVPPPMVTGTISLVRLSADAGCAQPATPKTSRGFSGTWYNPATSGQGLLFDLSATNGGFFFGGWFTYSQSSGTSQQWYTLQGAFPNDATEGDIPVYVAKTETFGSTISPPNGEPNTHQIGSAHIKFTSCTDAQLEYNLPQGVGASGSIPLKRLTPVPDDCLLH